jgi:hypothetical protein
MSQNTEDCLLQRSYWWDWYCLNVRDIVFILYKDSSFSLLVSLISLIL